MRSILPFGLSVWLITFAFGQAMASNITVFHADSLAGPMESLKAAFEDKNKPVSVKLVPGRSEPLAEQILKGDPCDLFAPSSSAVIENILMGKKVAGTERDAASWYIIFSANEMVVITRKGNPLGIKKITDLSRPEVKFARVTGEKDLATNRTITFLKQAAALEGQPEAAQKIIDGSVTDPSKSHTVPDTIRAVIEGKANAGIVYYSAAIAAKDSLDILRFPAHVNLSDKIQNAVTVPGTAKNKEMAIEFIKFILSVEGQNILKNTGQPPIVPPIRKGVVPADIQ
jgi:molybdenum ABC transporter molybdate-binding protein